MTVEHNGADLALGRQPGPLDSNPAAPTPKMPKAEMSLQRMLALTRDGATLDWQPNLIDGRPEPLVVMPTRKGRRR